MTNPKYEGDLASVESVEETDHCKRIKIHGKNTKFTYADFEPGVVYDMSDLMGPDPSPVQPVGRKTRKLGRNEKCPCGSGVKFKGCCAWRCKS